ncbi:hypothetical protein K788_0002428 [Paraburkholderia caribensis MBA4]|uniref:Uncharacterized protein n=1 Tax=Paraburkholderia caribensis MBA4 TaxID=1323664 RepID=A0A0P0R9G9_9BURK|nr:hypothetical protein K788_0002428 [Paraburkholderia caribensis MBA4]
MRSKRATPPRARARRIQPIPVWTLSCKTSCTARRDVSRGHALIRRHARERQMTRRR